MKQTVTTLSEKKYMPKTKDKTKISLEERQRHADKFVNCPSVRHVKTGRSGQVLGICKELAVPTFWITWDETETQLKATEQADPLDLELIQPDAKARQIFGELLEEQAEFEFEDAAATALEEPEIILPRGQDDEKINQSFPSALLPTAAGVATPSIDSPRSNMINFTSGAATVGRDEPVAADSVTNSQPQGTLEAEADDTNESIGSAEQPPEELLTPDEIADRHRLELRVERAFYESGSALRQLRDRRLYRSTHKSFDDYCQDRFGYKRAYCYFLIDAADVVENLMSTNSRQILPTRETQVRPLTSLEPDEQPQAWQEAVEQAGNKVPPARIVKDVVLRRKGIVDIIKKKNAAPCLDTCKPGQIFKISAKAGSGWLKKYDGCWAIAKAVNNFSLEIEVYSEVLTQVKPENLIPVDCPQECREIAAIAERVRRLRESGLLDRFAYNVLEHLGKQTYLLESEEEALTGLERRFLINSSKK